jgi:pectin methylesterase-like acyl-CoA thioesterase
MTRHRTAILLGLALSARIASAAACPNGALACEDFEHGTRLRAADGTAPELRPQPGRANHVLLLRGDGRPLLLPAAPPAGPYFVEARLRPAAGPDAAPRHAYLIARYADDRNWLGLALGTAPDGRRLAIDIVRMQDGQLRRLKQGGTRVDAPDSFTTLRLDVDGNTLAMYVNGSRINGVDEPSLPPARVGVLAQDGDFELDDLRTGDARVAPVRVGLAGMSGRLDLQAGDAPQRYLVRASANTGPGTGTSGGALPFVVASSAPDVATARMDGDAVVIEPKRAGAATITVASAQDNNAAATLAVRVGPAFTASDRVYALQGKVTPAAGAADVQVDTLLRLRFDAAPQLGPGASVRIFRAADDVLVDVLRLDGDVDDIGPSADGRRRVVRYDPVRIDGRDVTIRPHDGRLAYGTGYYVLVDAGAFPGARLGGVPFTGIGKAAGWRFTTRARMPTARDLTVDDDGPADFRTVQGALDHVMRNVPRAAPVTIRVADGHYDGLLYLRGKDNVTLRGASRDGTVIAAENSDGPNPGAGGSQDALAPGTNGGRSVFLIEDADLVTLDNLSVVNTTWLSRTTGGQAEALNFASDGRFIATGARFASEQDTILVRGYTWFYRSLVEGNVDFIWGYSPASLFEDSEIRTVGNSAAPAKGGYIVQARTPSQADPGFVFLNSRITHGPGPAGNDAPAGASFLARPGSSWDNVSYINCRIDGHISPRGWSGQPRGGTGWFEYNSMDMTGRPLDLAGRGGGRVLNAAQAARFSSRARVFAGFGGGQGWNPQAGASR